MGRLDGKVAIVTGAASGIGSALVARFAAEGAQVLGVDRSQRRLDMTRDALALDPATVAYVRADVATDDEVADFVAEALSRFGRLDILVANAGVGGTMTPIMGLDPEPFMETLRVNVLGPALLIKHGAPALTAQGSGSIIVTASIAGQRANSGPLDYSASKAGAISLVQNAAQALGRKGVRVNALCPAGTSTPMTRASFEMMTAAFGSNPLADLNPMRRVGTVDDMAGAAIFLASNDSAYINGQMLNVCGGLSAAHPAPAIVTDNL